MRSHKLNEIESTLNLDGRPTKENPGTSGRGVYESAGDALLSLAALNYCLALWGALEAGRPCGCRGRIGRCRALFPAL